MGKPSLEIQKSAVRQSGQGKTQKHAAPAPFNPSSMVTAPASKIDPASSKGVKCFDKK